MTSLRHPASDDLLARPVWHALAGRQAALAIGDGAALRMEPGIGPFAATHHPADPAALPPLLECGGELWLVERGETAAPPGLMRLRAAACVQMVAEAIGPGPVPAEIVELGAADAAEMHALAALTRPGPFHAATWRLGGFVGVRVGGRLVAMAGERLKPGRFTEVSGVCTHPDHRGHGLASGLMRVVSRRIVARGETPFLHCYADNDGAIALYERLGFVRTGEVVLTVLGRG